MSYIHYKFVYNKSYDKITFDGVSLQLSQLKKNIFEKIKFAKQIDFDLEITNADTHLGKNQKRMFSFRNKIFYNIFQSLHERK